MTNTLIRSIALAALSLSLAGAALAGAALAGDMLLGGGSSPNKVLSANLAIKSPITNVCPTSAKLSAAVVQTTNKPVQIMITRIGQGVGAPIMLQPKKAANGKWVAVYKKTIQILSSTNAQYKVLVGGGQGVTSNIAPLNASCKIAGGPGGLLLGG